MNQLSQEEITQALAALEDTAANFTANEDSNLFGLGLAIRASVLAGVPVEPALIAVGTRTGRSKAKVWKAYSVGMVFGNDIYAEFDWQLHVHCATADGVDPANPDTYQIAHKWRDVAEDGIETTRTYKSGKVVKGWRMHTARTLRAAIRKQAGGKPNPETLYSGTALYRGASVRGDVWAEMTLVIPHDVATWSNFQSGETYHITITREPQPATEKAQAAA